LERGGERERPRDLLVGNCPATRELRGELELAARTPSTVLLTGETGVGKGLAARWIHGSSDRTSQPFVHVDCAALAPGVIESELFGHDRGAFTGAVQGRIGRFELAQAGTVFLDEIGDLPLELQAKLLRVLDDREYERLGSAETRRMAARIVAASNRDLWRRMCEGRFREDLLYRLHVIHIRVPSLRERTTDLPLLVEHAVDRIARRIQLPRPKIRESFLHRLMAHDWPGNVRELMNLLERLMVRRAGVEWDASLLAGAFDRPLPMGVERPRLRAAERSESAEPGDSERDRLRAVLRETGGNVAEAARLLGMARSTLRYRMRIRGLAPSRETPGIAGKPGQGEQLELGSPWEAEAESRSR
jgi:transcriptional regulator with GAF, ATPase, and Fis domain